MDLLLTHGYFLSEDPHERAIMRPYPPMGLLYLSSHLKAKGFEVSVFDTTFSDPPAFTRLLEDRSPRVVGIYANLLTRQRVLQMVRVCKGRGITVVVGGPDAANYPEEYVARGADVVAIGEAEETLQELLPELERPSPVDLFRIRGLAFRGEAGSLVKTTPRPHLSDLDAQPLPDRGAVDIGRYLDVWREHHGSTSLSILTARGCSYRCSWCSHSVFGYTHRRRSPEKVAEELERLVAEYQPDRVWYADDVFTMSRDWLTSYSEALHRRGLRVSFEATSREDRLDEDTIELLADLGCYRLWLGVESGSQRVLDAMGRKTSAQRACKMIHLLRKHGIQTGVFIMLGYEGEEMADLEATVRFLKESKPDSFLTTLAYPIKGTPYYQEVADRVVALKPWEEGSDRDNTVAGRHSRRFYSFANRWMVGEVSLARQWGDPRRDYLRIVRSFAGAGLGRLGMAATRHEREGPGR
jgi:anaerobic magnesium-protoporphyrin IX monomethyl ester cyclase